MATPNAPQKIEDELEEADLKVILLGDSAVGKSKLVERYLLNNYVPRQLSTYALTLFRHKTTMDGKEYTIDFWDTAGQERFNSLHPSYYFNANACILCFDVTRKITYKNLQVWYQEMRQYCPHIPCILVANKIDVDYKVTQKSFQFASKNELPFFFVSASDGTNVVKVFNEAVKMAKQNKENPPDEFMATVMDLLKDDAFLFKEDEEAAAAAAAGSTVNATATGTVVQ
eukprot:GILK01001295.1.p1 GENE.GILK01001295.1~~GILK01001295.1.p1  ORF type:complete len:243 (-),score=45.07 GILK01001295.1:268-951(-)